MKKVTVNWVIKDWWGGMQNFLKNELWLTQGGMELEKRYFVGEFTDTIQVLKDSVQKFQRGKDFYKGILCIITSSTNC